MKKISFLLFLVFPLCNALMAKDKIVISCNTTNDLFKVLVNNNIKCVRYENPDLALKNVPNGGALLILADNYPHQQVKISKDFYKQIAAKNVRAYIEYPSFVSGLQIDSSRKSNYERAIISSDFFGCFPDKSSILSINGLNYLIFKSKIDNPHIVAARVAGFGNAIFGLPAKVDPLLFQIQSGILISSTGLSNFVSGRYAPGRDWASIWKSILKYTVSGIKINELSWQPEIDVTYKKHEKLPSGYNESAILRGMQWYKNAKMLVAPSLVDSFQKLITAGVERIRWDKSLPIGDGNNGSLECIFSEVDEKGSQPIGIIVRGDCVSETAMAFAASDKALKQEGGFNIAKNLLDFYLHNSRATKNEYGDPNHGAYGLIPWGISNYAWYRASYGDDNARVILATIITSSILKTNRWDEKIMRSLFALLRTTGKNGFRGDRIDLPDFEKNGWRYYFNRELTNLSPHFEAYLWACFIWAYNQTGDKLFLERAEKGIRTLMENYPEKLVWTNGLAQEKARMLLPLAWLVRAKDSDENRNMLMRVVNDVISLQDEETGALREELGSISKGKFPPPQSNEAYGTNEASLIAKNGDAVSDLLYTTNFAFLGLHEVLYTLDNPIIKNATNKLSDFLCRIQVKSKKHPEIDGGWMRAFDYKRFEHWGSNADAGWGAWAIESGWTQGWITCILALRKMNTSIWDLTKDSKIENYYPILKQEMFK